MAYPPDAIDWPRRSPRGSAPAQAGPDPEGREGRGGMLVRALDVRSGFVEVLIAAGFILTILLFYAQYSGAVRWILVLIAVAFGVLVVTRWVAVRVRDPPPLTSPRVPSAAASGDLGSLAATLERADAGLPYSQAVFSERLTNAFLERVRIARSLTPEEMDVIRTDSARLERLLGDAELAEFVREGDRLVQQWPDLARRGPRGRGYMRRARRVLDKMEVWS